MKRHWTNEELAEHWILSCKELDLIGDSKTDHNLLGAACLLKYFQQEGRFPAQKQDIPPIVIVHLAQQLGVIPEKIIPYDWEGRTIKAHRAAIRTFLDVHEATLADEEALVEWLCQEVVAEQRQEEALIASLYTRCKEQRIDPPTPDRVRRLVHTALHRFDERLCATVMQQLSLETRTRLDALLTVEFSETQAREETTSALEEASGEAGTAEASQEPALPVPSRPSTHSSTMPVLSASLASSRKSRSWSASTSSACLRTCSLMCLPRPWTVTVTASPLRTSRRCAAIPVPSASPCLLPIVGAGGRKSSISWLNCCWMSLIT